MVDHSWNILEFSYKFLRRFEIKKLKQQLILVC